MSEIKIFYKDKEKIKVARTISALKELDKKDIIWIDLLDVSDKTEDTLEGFLKIDIQEDEEMEEIEFSSRYIQTDDSIVANSNFLKSNFETEPVNFILKNGISVMWNWKPSTRLLRNFSLTPVIFLRAFTCWSRSWRLVWRRMPT